MMNKFFVIIATVLLLASCGDKEKKSYDTMGFGGLTERTENLAENLKANKEHGVMIGQMYGTIRGIGWEGDSARSDIHSICNDMPACNGYELAGLEKGGTRNVDGISASLMRRDILETARRQGLSIVFWTIPDPKGDEDLLKSWTETIAKYFDSLQDGYGIKAPVVLMLMPLNDDNLWYSKLSADDYKDTYDKVADWLKDDFNTTNVLFGYSCHATQNAEDFSAKYPGTDISLVNMTCYADSTMGIDKYKETMTRMMDVLNSIGQERSVPVGITTGYICPPTDTFWSDIMTSIVKKGKLVYCLFGQNKGEALDKKNYVPFPGGSLVEDFVKFYNDTITLFAHDINGLYLKSE